MLKGVVCTLTWKHLRVLRFHHFGESMHADCVRCHQDQPLLAGFLSAWSVPPAPEVPPLQPLLELPAPAFFPLHALVPAHPLKASVEPEISPAIHRPARIFFRSLVSIMASCLVEDAFLDFPWGRICKRKIHTVLKQYRLAYFMNSPLLIEMGYQNVRL